MAATIAETGKLTERQKRFALAYLRLANGTKAAIEAGYSEKSAPSTGSQLIRHPKVLEFIEQNRVRKDVHADVTYQNQIKLTNVAFSILNETLQEGNTYELKEKILACENARRCQETLARIEGLMAEVPAPPDSGRMTLQALAQKLRTNLVPHKIEVSPVAASTLVEVREVETPPASEQPLNGNGHAA